MKTNYSYEDLRHEFKKEITRKINYINRVFEELGDCETYMELRRITRREIDGIIDLAMNIELFTDEEIELLYQEI